VRCGPIETEIRTFVCTSTASLRGFRGAPARHGTGCGRGQDVDVEYDPDTASLAFPFIVDLYHSDFAATRPAGSGGLPLRKERRT